MPGTKEERHTVPNVSDHHSHSGLPVPTVVGQVARDLPPLNRNQGSW